MEEAMWSRHFACELAQTVGYRLPGGGEGLIDLDPEGETVVGQVTEALRYLPMEQINCAFDFAAFLRTKVDGFSCPPPALQVAIRFRQVRDVVLSLRDRYGTDRPADEKDYWTDEDRQDARAASLRRLDQEDPIEDDYTDQA